MEGNFEQGFERSASISILSLIAPDAMSIDSKLFSWNREILASWETFLSLLQS